VAAGTLTLEIADDGRGLSLEDLAKARSFGIRGLHERASTVGGWVDLSSGERGTTLILSVPLAPDAADGADAAGASQPEPADIHDQHDPSYWGEL
jgi:signal transduction histidine kinase